jgi:hypothetical protein
MLSLFAGVALLGLAVFMLRLAHPQPDGTPARFVGLGAFGAVYATAFTAIIAFGGTLFIVGLVSLF